MSMHFDATFEAAIEQDQIAMIRASAGEPDTAIVEAWTSDRAVRGSRVATRAR